VDRVRFIAHQGKQILFIDMTNCVSEEAMLIASEVQRAARVMHLHRNCHAPENITARPAPANHAPPVRGFCRTVIQGGV